MPVSINNTTLTFNDATTQTTSAVTSVGVGTGLSSTGGKTPTLTNTGVTSVSGAGTVSVSASSGAVTITGTGGSGTVISVATGNGLQGGTITSSGTLSVACPTFDSVGSYGFGLAVSNSSVGGNYSFQYYQGIDGEGSISGFSTHPGSWKLMGVGTSGIMLICRVS